MTRTRKIKAELKALRANCIEQDADPLLRDVAYVVEQVVRYVTERGIVGWPSLSAWAKNTTQIIRRRAEGEEAGR